MATLYKSKPFRHQMLSKQLIIGEAAFGNSLRSEIMRYRCWFAVCASRGAQRHTLSHISDMYAFWLLGDATSAIVHICHYWYQAIIFSYATTSQLEILSRWVRLFETYDTCGFIIHCSMPYDMASRHKVKNFNAFRRHDASSKVQFSLLPYRHFS